MPREGQPATPSGGSGTRDPRRPPEPAGPPPGSRVGAPPPSRQTAPSPRTGAPTTSRRPPGQTSLEQPRRPAPAARRPEPIAEPSLENHLEAALDTFRPSRAVTAFKKASALTRWIILIVIVGIGAAAVTAIALAALFTLVDSSV